MQGLDKQGVLGCLKGDSKSQKAVFEALYLPMFRVCYRYTSHKENAEDCLMKGFMKAFQSLSKFSYREQGSFEHWVRRIMVNECLMFLRKKSNLLFPGEEVLPSATLPAAALQNLEADELQSMILSLPVGYRTVFNLFAVEGYSHKEIASLLKINENTSKSQFLKARLKLQEILNSKKEVSYGRL